MQLIRKFYTHPPTTVDHVDVHTFQANFPSLRDDFLETGVVRLSGGPQKGRRAPGGYFPRGRHFWFDRLFAYVVCRI